MNDTTILGLIIAGLIAFILTIVRTISQMQNDIARINITLNKISKQVGVPDTLTAELKSLILNFFMKSFDKQIFTLTCKRLALFFQLLYYYDIIE
ncbi:MAG TPA: hypothetical protein VIM42_01440 [Clostridium sp.]